jgi:hypothetical protein
LVLAVREQIELDWDAETAFEKVENCDKTRVLATCFAVFFVSRRILPLFLRFSFSHSSDKISKQSRG